MKHAPMTTTPQAHLDTSWTVWKFPLLQAESQIVEMPAGAEALHVAEQRGAVFLWARVCAVAPPVKRQVFIAGTGHVAPPPTCKHIGSVLLFDGGLAFHFFILPESPDGN